MDLQIRISLLLLIASAILTDVECQEEYQLILLQLHNDRRQLHTVDPLTISEDLNDKAVRCAEYYAARRTIDHSCPYKEGAGENLWLQGGGSPTNDEVARSSFSSWYDSEEPLHDYDREFQQETGHFSQIVWKTTSHFGFGVGHAGIITVGCGLYSPPGNVLGQFKDNVFPPNSSSNSGTENFADDGSNTLPTNSLLSALRRILTVS